MGSIPRFLYGFCVVMLMATCLSARVVRAPEAVPNRYMVVLKDVDTTHVAGHAKDLEREFGGSVLFSFQSIPGFSMNISSAAAEALSHHPLVEYVEEVATVRYPEGEVTQSTGYQTVTGAGLWHLDRLDERQIDDANHLDGLYAFCTSSLVNAYVVDSGVRASHIEFQSGQVTDGYDATLGAVGSYGTPSDPCPETRPATGYHGTAVASVLAGLNTGVSKYTRIVPVRVFGCTYQSSTDIVVRGLDWIRVNGVRPAVVNISWFTSDSTTLKTALTNLEAAGFPIFVSANNFPESDACTRYPAGYAKSKGGPVITMGGTMIGSRGTGIATGDWVDYRWQRYSDDVPLTGQDNGSSWGPCVDLWAPADSTKVADYESYNTYFYLSGTSFSAPMAAGVAARYLSQNPSASTTAVWDYIRNGATPRDSSNAILVRDVKATSPNGSLLYFLDSCRSRPIIP